MVVVTLCNTEHETVVMESFGNYFETEEYLDVTFLCSGGKKVRAHKMVLMSVSPFLKELLQNWEGPADDIVVSIPDVSHRGMRLLLAFIYDGVMKLSAEEMEGFRAAMETLCLKLPDAVISQVLPLSAACPPPPTRRLDQSQRISLGRAQQRARENSQPGFVTPEEEHRMDTITVEDDPLNVPDFYFMPTAPAKAVPGELTAHSQVDDTALASSVGSKSDSGRPGSSRKRVGRPQRTRASELSASKPSAATSVEPPLYVHLQSIVDNTVEETLLDGKQKQKPSTDGNNTVGGKKASTRGRKRQSGTQSSAPSRRRKQNLTNI